MFEAVNSLRIAGSVAVLAAGVALGGCTTLSAGESTTLAAPLQNGVLASEFASLTGPARVMAANAEYKALESGQTGAPVRWKQSEAVFGSVVPQQPYSVGSTNCRRYVHSVTVDGDSRAASGTACRSADGVWEPLT